METRPLLDKKEEDDTYGTSASIGNKEKNGKRVSQWNNNTYATKKTVAKGLLDIALFTSNVLQLKYVLLTDNHPFYIAMIVLISISMFFQITMGVCLIVIGSININAPKYQGVATILNDVITLHVVIITALNIVISAFGMESIQ